MQREACGAGGRLQQPSLSWARPHEASAFQGHQSLHRMFRDVWWPPPGHKLRGGRSGAQVAVSEDGLKRQQTPLLGARRRSRRWGSCLETGALGLTPSPAPEL